MFKLQFSELLVNRKKKKNDQKTDSSLNQKVNGI